ncbi:UNVERIFIED_CONTAM: hypothetical protein FKN15_035368 [Acipenser sinensis]
MAQVLELLSWQQAPVALVETPLLPAPDSAPGSPMETQVEPEPQPLMAEEDAYRHKDSPSAHSPGAHFLATRFFKGARQLCSPRRTTLPKWSLDVVLEVLMKAPF